MATSFPHISAFVAKCVGNRKKSEHAIQTKLVNKSLLLRNTGKVNASAENAQRLADLKAKASRRKVSNRKRKRLQGRTFNRADAGNSDCDKTPDTYRSDETDDNINNDNELNRSSKSQRIIEQGSNDNQQDDPTTATQSNVIPSCYSTEAETLKRLAESHYCGGIPSAACLLGQEVTVKRCKTESLQGICGVVVKQSNEKLHIETYKGIRVVPLQASSFTFHLNGRQFRLIPL